MGRGDGGSNPCGPLRAAIATDPRGATLSAEPSSDEWTFWDVPSMPPDAAWREKRRLAAALRELSALCVTTDAPDATLGDAADSAERLVDRLRQHPARTFQQGMATATSRDQLSRFADRSTLTGLSNPNSPPLALSMEGEQAIGTVTFGPPFEGIPGHVHGGLVAAAFDQVFGYLQVKRGMGAVTSVLTVRYRRPTPLLAPLRIEARVVRVEGRTSTVAARMLAGENVTADADGTFVMLDSKRLSEIISGKHD
jgi:acyl-coenzyme A thioesterase PaaI-like protein